MKRILLTSLMLSVISFGLQAQHPFLEKGKTWHVMNFSMGGHIIVQDYYVENDTVVDGKTYFKVFSKTDEGTRLEVLLREEEQRVYRHSLNSKGEYIIYDFNLKEGDTFVRHLSDDNISCCVKKVEMVNINGEDLKQLTIECSSEMEPMYSQTMTWTEGTGYRYGLLDGIVNFAASSWSRGVIYVYNSQSDNLYYPFPFSYSRWHGSPLAVEKVDAEVADGEKLNYELVNEELHVSGFMEVPCNDNLYIYCIDEGSYNDRRLTFKVEQVGTPSDSYHLGKVDFWLRYFDEYVTYTIIDNEGTHLVTSSIPSIHNRNGHNSFTTTMYDLTGRRLSTAPQHGIYIQDGRKVFK
ncbi:MAG: hypothetical protein IKN83_01235 [Bacteroidaceae bacterium]|nr:hypothetical protein [Bacteroidaceae bacterium]